MLECHRRHPAFPTTDSGTMTSRPNSKQSSRGHSPKFEAVFVPTPRLEAVHKGAAVEAGAGQTRQASCASAMRLTRWNPWEQHPQRAAHSKPPPYGKNMGAAYYEKVVHPRLEPAPSAEACGHNNRYTPDNGSLPEPLRG